MRYNLRILAALLSGISVPYTGSFAVELDTEGVLTVDEPISDSLLLEFPDEGRLEPKIGEFRILSSLVMSAESGERWATVTVKNISSHQRLLDHEHIVALFANGERRNPAPIKFTLSGGEEITVVLNFGIHKFPVLRLYTRN